MMEVSRHKSVDTLRGYVRRADLFRDHGARRSCDRQRNVGEEASRIIARDIGNPAGSGISKNCYGDAR